MARGRDRPGGVEVGGMRRPLRILALLQVGALAVGVSAALAGAPAAAPPAGAISKNVAFVTNLPEAATAISINFIDDAMFVSTVKGLLSYDISDPTHPQLLGALPYYIWENEDVSVDAKRHLLFVSRDPRGFTSPATTAFPDGAVEVYDVSNPSVFRPVSVTTLPTGHTTTCVAGCRWTWTGGPATSPLDAHDWTGGRPILPPPMAPPANPGPPPGPIRPRRAARATSPAPAGAGDPR